VRIVHLSDVHIWRYEFNPMRLFSKRALGIAELLRGRARRFRLERIDAVVQRAVELEPDHVLITGDLTTTALPTEFRAARLALAPLLADASRATVIPGNHDRYTGNSVRTKQFESYFGEFAPGGGYPWLRPLDAETAILGLDPTRSHINARGYLPPSQLAAARALVLDPQTRPRRLIVACHYPLAAPPPYVAELAQKRLKNAEEAREWLSGIGPHLFCCGHVHAAWAFRPTTLPEQLCLNSGAPLLRDPTGLHPPGFLEITLVDDNVSVIHHAWTGSEWSIFPLVQTVRFFAGLAPTPGPS